MESIELTLQWFQGNEKIFKEQSLKIKELEETLIVVNEEMDIIKNAFKKDIEIATDTIRVLEEEKRKFKERAELAEMDLKELICLIRLDMY